jgi:uncharacterized FAD-dependent dehydrogenase
MKAGNSFKICIVGLGPAGIGAALTFMNSNLASYVVCLDAGNSTDKRFCEVLLKKSDCRREKTCQMISGFGGCSFLSGGKISAFPAGSRLKSILGSEDLAEKELSRALRLLSNYLPLQKPNITPEDTRTAKELFEKLGFEYKYYDSFLCSIEKLHKAYQEMFSDLEAAGTRLLLNTEVIGIYPKKTGFELVARQGERIVTFFAEHLVLGVGRLGRTMLRNLNTKLNLAGKENHLDVGVRLEFPTNLFPDITKFHNDLKLIYDNARTFCVCKDGKIAPYLLEDVFFTDGYSSTQSASGFTNVGITLRLQPSKRNRIILDGIKKILLTLGDGRPVRQALPNYLGICSANCNSHKHIDSSISFWILGDVNLCFPQPISTKIREAVYYFASRLLPYDRWGEVSVFAPEVEFGGLTFPVKSDFSIISRMYLIGDCTGRFRGVLQAFCSGIICAENISGDIYEKRP